MFNVTKAQIIMELEISIKENRKLVEVFETKNNILSCNYHRGRASAFERALNMIKKMKD